MWIRPSCERFLSPLYRKMLRLDADAHEGPQMKRRNFMAALAGVAVLRPAATNAQRPQRSVPLVGVIWVGTASAPISVSNREAFLRGLRENGYIVSQNITVEERYSGN